MPLVQQALGKERCYGRSEIRSLRAEVVVQAKFQSTVFLDLDMKNASRDSPADCRHDRVDCLSLQRDDDEVLSGPESIPLELLSLGRGGTAYSAKGMFAQIAFEGDEGSPCEVLECMS